MFYICCDDWPKKCSVSVISVISSVLLIIIIQRILRWIISTSFLQQLRSFFYSAHSFYSLLIKCDFLSGCLYFFFIWIFDLTELSTKHPIPLSTLPLAQLHSPLCCLEPPLEKVTALEKHWREKLSCFVEAHGADHVFLSGLMLSGKHKASLCIVFTTFRESVLLIKETGYWLFESETNRVKEGVSFFPGSSSLSFKITQQKDRILARSHSLKPKLKPLSAAINVRALQWTAPAPTSQQCLKMLPAVWKLSEWN